MGKPGNSWRRSTLRETGRSWSQLRYLAADRDKWKISSRRFMLLVELHNILLFILQFRRSICRCKEENSVVENEQHCDHDAFEVLTAAVVKNTNLQGSMFTRFRRSSDPIFRVRKYTKQPASWQLCTANLQMRFHECFVMSNECESCSCVLDDTRASYRGQADRCFVFERSDVRISAQRQADRSFLGRPRSIKA
jgi:hypothetical protein